MKAIVQGRYGPPGDVLELRDIERPVAADDAALVRVQATTVNPADWHFIRGEPYLMRLQAGLRKPKDTVLGCDLAERVEAVGGNVAGIKPGDEVLGSPFLPGSAPSPSMHPSRPISWRRSRPTSPSSRRRPCPWPR
jgi:NADPH:quinone reductase-like Zn-dependent oxidoreductase